MIKILFYIKKIINYFNFQYLLSLTVYSIIILYTLNTSKNTDTKTQPYTLNRQLQEIENQTFYKKLSIYDMVNTIVNKKYNGEWNSSSNQNESGVLTNKNGKAKLEIRKNKTISIENIDEKPSVLFIISIIDGYYKDKEMFFKFNYTFKSNDYTSMNENIDISRETWVLLDKVDDDNCKSSKISLSFNEKMFNIRSKEHPNLVESFNDIAISIVNENVDCLMEISLNFNYNPEDYFSYKIWNYSLFTSILIIYQCFNTSHLYLKANENNYIGTGLSSIGIAINIIWNSIISLFHFFISASNPKYSIEFLVLFFLFFFQFAIIELKLLYVSFKSKYYHLQFSNEREFKYKLFLSYLCFYFFLILSLIFMKTFYKSSFFLIVFFTFTWLPQISHSAITSIKPPFNQAYINSVSFLKLFFIGYFYACPWNFLQIKPRPIVFLTVFFIVLFEMLVLKLQKAYFPKIIIPLRYRSQPYNYFISDVNIESSTECSICLDSLSVKRESKAVVKPLENDNSNQEIFENEDNNDSFLLSFNSLIQYFQNSNQQSMSNQLFLKLLLNIKKIIDYIIIRLDRNKVNYIRTNLMQTPCKHLFHSSCLESWMDIKSECPFCRNSIPPLE